MPGDIVDKHRQSSRINPDVLDAWNARGLYKTKIIEFDDDVKLFRVYPESGHPVIWQYFRSSPNDKNGKVEFGWVASCMAPPGSTEQMSLAAI